jgi:hypothetical protein
MRTALGRASEALSVAADEEMQRHLLNQTLSDSDTDGWVNGFHWWIHIPMHKLTCTHLCFSALLLSLHSPPYLPLSAVGSHSSSPTSTDSDAFDDDGSVVGAVAMQPQKQDDGTDADTEEVRRWILEETRAAVLCRFVLCRFVLCRFVLCRLVFALTIVS